MPTETLDIDVLLVEDDPGGLPPLWLTRSQLKPGQSPARFREGVAVENWAEIFFVMSFSVSVISALPARQRSTGQDGNTVKCTAPK
jgi:hypothetical protein